MKRKKYLWNDGKGHTYVRIKGKYHPITAREGTPEFDAQYWDILSGKTIVAKTSWNALIQSYRRSDRWGKLKPRTQRDYEKVLTYIEKCIGTKNTAVIARKHVIEAMEANRHRVRFANYIPQVMSVLLEHAIDIGWRKDNPARGTKLLSVPKTRTQPHKPWTNAAVAKWRDEALPLPRLIFEIGIGTVQRPGDWLQFTWGDYDGECLKLSQGKTGRALTLPCTLHLRTALEDARRNLGASPLPTRPILTKANGERMDYRYMARIMRDERERLGTTEFDNHSLRYRGVMELAWAGCDDDEIASYSGHASKDMIRKYAGEARQIMRARQASEKRK